MSRVATNNSTTNYYNNGVGQPKTSLSNPISSNSINKNSTTNGSGHAITVRSAAPPPVHKETLHACPICNGEYKDPRVLPCTHTYCFNCIRDKLIANNRVTCPKCNQQVEPFDENELNELPRNIILSQGWRMSVQPAPALPVPKKPPTYQPPVSTPTKMSTQQDKRKSSIAESVGQDSTSSRKKSHGLSSLVSVFSRSSEPNGKHHGRSSRSPSISSAPSVSNLIKIYAEATAQHPQYQQQISQQSQHSQQSQQSQQHQHQQHHHHQHHQRRSESIASTGRTDELIRIVQQAGHYSQHRASSAASSKTPSHAREEAYEDMTWDSLMPGPIPAAPPIPDQWQKATEHFHQPAETPKRPSSVAQSDRSTGVENLRAIIAGVNEQASGRTFPSFPQESIQISQMRSRPSTASHSQNDFDDEDEEEDDDDDDDVQLPKPPSIYASIPPRTNSRPDSRTNSVHTNASSATAQSARINQPINANQQRTSAVSTPQKKQEQTDKMSQRSSSLVSPTGRSQERLPPPSIEPYDFINELDLRRRSPSNLSIPSTTSTDRREQTQSNQNIFLSTERFKASVDIPPPIQTHTSSRTPSQVHSGLSTPTNRPGSRSMERDTHYLTPTKTPSTTIALTPRFDSLSSDQKRLERDIEEQIRQLKYDYDDVRKQISQKEASIHSEVRGIATNLDDSITQHYQQQQRAYADLAADTNTIGNELERLRSEANTSPNKQQLLDSLEKIEFSIRKIREAVEQQKQSRPALTFYEGHRSIAADTIGQVTYHQVEPNRPVQCPPPLPSTPALVSTEHSSGSIVPYKYVKIDHLSALEPESIAITENNKKILLGICNKLFILNDYGELLKTIQLAPSIRGITISKRPQTQNIAYISHEETVSMIDIDNGEVLDSVKETDSSSESGTFLPVGIDTDNIRGDVYVCDYRNSCVIRFDDKLEFITLWRIYNHSDQYDEARPKLISVYGQKLYVVIENSCKPYYNQGISYSFSLHICDANTGNIIRIIDADSLGPQRLRWPCSVQATPNNKCYILDTMTSGKYFNGHWQKHWSRVLEVGQDGNNAVSEIFQLDSEAETMAMTKQVMIISANGDILFVDLGFLFQQNPPGPPPSQQQQQQQRIIYDHSYQNLP